MSFIDEDEEEEGEPLTGFAVHEHALKTLSHEASIAMVVTGPAQKVMHYGVISLPTYRANQDAGVSQMHEGIVRVDVVTVLDKNDIGHIREVAATYSFTMQQAKNAMAKMAEAQTPLCRVMLSPVDVKPDHVRRNSAQKLLGLNS